MVIKNKKINFISFFFILVLNLDTVIKNKIKKGISIPICLAKNVKGNNKCDSKKFTFSVDVLSRAYKIVV